MRSRWEIWTSTTRGKRLRLRNGVGSFAVARALNAVGEWSIDLPRDFDMDLVPLDNIVEFWRAAEGRQLGIYSVGFIKQRDKFTRAKQISGPDCKDILATRIIAYNAGSANASKTDYYDDMMKDIIRENLGSTATDTDRDLSNYNFTVLPDLSDAPSKTMEFSRANVLDTLVKIANASREAGTELYFDLIPVVQSDQSLGFRFETAINQPGQDRRAGTENPVFFGERFGNLADAHWQENARGEVNDVYAGGQGIDAARLVEHVENNTRILRSPWNRREGFVELSNSSSSDTLVAIGQAEITVKRPRIYFSGTLVDTARARFGRDWDLGYRVTIDHDNQQYDTLIKYVEISVSRGKETISADVEIEQ